ncbi:hypothetical protein [Alicyclobacillus acidiphilus]|nr:hypothetical protein [Alicyclobacillus acidiphilus]
MSKSGDRFARRKGQKFPYGGVIAKVGRSRSWLMESGGLERAQ